MANTHQREAGMGTANYQVDNNKEHTSVYGADASVITPEVIAALRNGRHEAFEKVYVHYRKPLFHFIRKLVGSDETAEEIIQDLFADLWEKRERLDPERNIKSYLFTIAKRTAFKRIFKREILEEYSSLLEDTVVEYRRTEDLLEAEETQLLIEVAIERMPRMRREIFRLYRDGMDIDAIAQKLSIKKENVSNHLTRARNNIRELVYLIGFFLLIS